MTGADIEQVVAGQAALIAALDAGDVAAIETATSALSAVLERMRGTGAATGIERQRVDFALRQGEAARTRVNFLADRNRQRLDRLAARRGADPAATYDARGALARIRT